MKDMIYLEPSDASSLVVVMKILMGGKKTKAIERHTGILDYLTKEWYIPIEEDVEDDEDKLKIYEGNCKAWDLLIISL